MSLVNSTWSLRLPTALSRELDGLRRESEPELRGEGLMSWARRVEAAGHAEVAAAVYDDLLADSDLSGSLRRRAGERRNVLGGGGSFSDRLEHQAGHLTQELLSPASILAMGAGGAVFRMTRWTMLGRLALLPAGFWTRGRTASALAGFAGFLLEAPAFTLSSQAFRSLGGETLPNRGQLGQELLRSYLSLGGLRLGGALAHGVQRGLGLESNLLAASVFRQAGMFGGILAAGISEERLELHGPRRASDRLFDSLVLLLHFNLGGHIAQQAFGPRFQAWEQAVDRQSLSLGRLPRTEGPAWNSPLLIPMWMMMGAGGSGGFGSPRGPQLSLPFFEPAPSRAANSRPPLFSAPDLALAPSLSQASTEVWSRGLESLRSRGILSTDAEQVSYIQNLRLRAGIPQLGEIFRAQGPASHLAGAALRELAAEDRSAVLHEFRRALRESHTLGAVQAIEALAHLQATEVLSDIQALPQNHPSPIAVAAEAARLRLGDFSLLPQIQRRAQNRRQNDIDRIAAWESVGRHGDRGLAVENLRGFFRYFHSAATQRRAALALTRLGASTAVLSLDHHVEHAPRWERVEFADAFFEQGSVEPALRIWDSLVASQAVEGRTAALSLSATHPMPAMVSGLRSLLSDAYPEVRRRAGQRLVELASRSGHTGTLESLLEWSNPASLRESEALQVRAAAALLAGGEHGAARERLETYLESSFSEIRLEAAEALLARGESAQAVQALRRLSQGADASLRHRAARLLLAQRGLENTSLWGRLGSSLGLFGLGALAWSFEPALAEASVGASPADASGWLLPTLLVGAAVMATARGLRGSEPPNPGSNPPPEILGRFENPWNSAEAYPLPTIGENGAVIGRSTLTVPNVFDADLRHIARRHMDLRVQEGRLEVRLHDGARGLRINGQNLLPFEWYPLRDQDLVEFVGGANADIPALARQADGSLVQGVLRLGQKPVESVDYPAIFRFRLNPPTPPPAITTPLPPRPPQNFLERLSGWFGGSRPAEEPAPTPSMPPPASISLRSDLYTDIHRLSQTLSTPMAVLEASLRSPSFRTPESRADALTALIRIHRQICGRAETVAWAGGWIRVPDWDGILAGRLENFGQELRRVEQERGPSPELQNAQLELGRIRDQLNRLFEMVRLFRRHFQEPEELVRFEAIEQAYRGLRSEVVPIGQRVRSATRGLDATVRSSDRELWTAEFESWDRPSRSMVNLRILLGEIREVRGRPVAGSFYTALSSGTIYEGRRNVRFHYDTSSGQILGFDDGSPVAEAAIQRFLQDRLNVEEGILSVDPSASGRITDVSLLGSPREAVVEALQGLVGLRVLPPQILHGWSGHEGDPNLQSYRIHLVPEFNSPTEEWYQVVGLIRDFEGDHSLLTLEPSSPGPSRQGIQILVPSIDTFGISVDDVLTVHAVSP